MTISTTQNRVSYNGNGVTTEFAFPYRFLANEDLLVILVETDGTEVTQVLDTDYTVTGVGTDSSGEVTMIVTPAVGERLVILRQVALTQETDYIEGDPFPAESHETALDKVTMGLQQMQEQIGRTLLLSPAVQSGVDNSLPNPQVGTVLGWADDGLSLVNRDVTDVTVLPPDLLRTGDIGTTVQAYDADTAKTDVAQNFTATQRSASLTDNDGSFDLSAKQNFKCTTAGSLTLTFTNQADGISGWVIFTNSSNHTVSAHANTKLTATDLSKLSTTGTYRIDYASDGTNAYCSVIGAYP